jgi:hypothetical protein
LVIIVAASSVLADGLDAARQVNCGRLNEDSIYITNTQVVTNGDVNMSYKRNYKQPPDASRRFRSSKIYMILDPSRAVYFETGGFDCTQADGNGSCSHFEFIAGGGECQRHMNDRLSWDKVANENIGGFISRCLMQPHK